MRFAYLPVFEVAPGSNRQASALADVNQLVVKPGSGTFNGVDGFRDKVEKETVGVSDFSYDDDGEPVVFEFRDRVT